MSTLLSLLVVVLLIALNALYVAAEFAVVVARPSRLQQLAAKGRTLAARLTPIVTDPAAIDRYIATCQVGITASSLILGALGVATLAPPLAGLAASIAGWPAVAAYPLASLIVLIGLTTAQMVLGELTPKAVALRFPAEAAMYTVLPVIWSQRLFSVLITLLNGSGLLLLRLLRVKHTATRHVHSAEEIDHLLTESSQGGVLAPEEAQRLHGALRLSTRTAAELMVPRDQIVALSADATADEILDLVSDSPYTRLPVYRGTLDTVLGILHTRDVLMAVLERGHVPPAHTLMRPAVMARASTRADHLLSMFREQPSQQALVTDDRGQVVGLVSLEDALTELFGELSDEFKILRQHRRRAEPAS